MDQIKDLQKLKMVRLDVTISPIHDRMLEEEIHQEELKGRKVTKSEIIRQELDGRYLTKRRKADS